ncbi:hypothetical protein ABB02_02000 [Clostridiaceae bacterium JG1575]|nr:hypothetical protein ABB02_02000 [Clostridiaceae bacterium JG1575]
MNGSGPKLPSFLHPPKGSREEGSPRDDGDALRSAQDASPQDALRHHALPKGPWSGPRTYRNNQQRERCEAAPPKVEPPLFKRSDGEAHAQSKVQRYERRKKERLQKKKQRTVRLVWGGVIGVAVLLIVLFGPFFRVSRIEVQGALGADAKKLEAAAAQGLGKSRFLLPSTEVKKAAGADPFIETLRQSVSASGVWTLEVQERSRDYLLRQGAEEVLLERTGRVLARGAIAPRLKDGVVTLTDDAKLLNPGYTMYAQGPKKEFLKEFADLMATNQSTIHFEAVDLTHIAAIRLYSKGWEVELGPGKDLKTKLNQAINILKSIGPKEPSGIIDLKYEAPPVIRTKGTSKP